MFGYITVNDQELKLREYTRYRSYYCGLCRELHKQYGTLGQLTLSYDMTFLVLLLSALYEPEETEETHRCIAHPASRHKMLYTPFTTYGADMNILLTYHNCMDDWFDDKDVVKLSMAKLLKKRYHRLADKYPRQTAAVTAYMERVAEAEAANAQDLDLISGFTGTLLGELFVYQEDGWSNDLRQTGFFMGKFIYLMDAWEDLEKDQKKEHYNPWKFYSSRPDFQDFGRNILTMMATECARAFERLPIVSRDVEILRNILYSGIWMRYAALEQKKGKDKDQENKT
jgi:hypothetical protein